MRVVIDTNVVISMLIKQSKPLELFLDDKLEIFSPNFILEEIENNKETILKKSKLSPELIQELFNIIKSRIAFVHEDEFKEKLGFAENICPDPKDVNYFALALHLNCAIWSNDKKLKKQDYIKVFLTHEILAMFDLIEKI